MSDYLVGPRLKIERARSHIQTIRTQFVAHASIPANGCGVVAQYDDHAGNLEIVVKKSPTAPDIVRVLIGEVLYHARSALDHLAFQLVIKKTGQRPKFNSAFPIVGRGRRIKKAWRSAADEFVAQTGRLKEDIPESALARIYELQPYHRGPAYEDDPLWVLQELNNVDKHRLLMVTPVFMGFGGKYEMLFSPEVTILPHREVYVAQRISLKQGAVLLRLPTVTREVSVNGKVSCAPAIRKRLTANHEPVIPLLTQLVDFTSNVIESFAPDFS